MKVWDPIKIITLFPCVNLQNCHNQFVDRRKRGVALHTTICLLSNSKKARGCRSRIKTRAWDCSGNALRTARGALIGFIKLITSEFTKTNRARYALPDAMTWRTSSSVVVKVIGQHAFYKLWNRKYDTRKNHHNDTGATGRIRSPSWGRDRS